LVLLLMMNVLYFLTVDHSVMMMTIQ